VASDDPTEIRVLAVTVDDVVAALEANERRSAGAVLRVTPPFSGRMRARLHRSGAEADYDDPEPLHVPPERFVDSPPPMPTPDDTEDELRADPDLEYDPETHRRRHEEALAEWRSSVRAAVLGRTTVGTPAGPREVEVAALE
jgi:hypothetical protein